MTDLAPFPAPTTSPAELECRHLAASIHLAHLAGTDVGEDLIHRHEALGSVLIDDDVASADENTRKRALLAVAELTGYSHCIHGLADA